MCLLMFRFPLLTCEVADVVDLHLHRKLRGGNDLARLLVLRVFVDDPKFGKGLLHTAKMWPGGRGIAIREEFFDVSKGR